MVAPLLPPTTQIFDTYHLNSPLGLTKDGTNVDLQKEYAILKHGTDFNVSNYDMNQMMQLQYLQSLEIEGSQTDGKTTWQVEPMIAHQALPAKGNWPQHVIVKVQWPNDKPTWVNIDALWMEQPQLLIEYIEQNGLEEHQD